MKTINEERLFKLIDNFFADPSAVLTEIAQNASRSGASWLHITLKDNELITADDGEGTVNPEALFVLADSDWNETVEMNQSPAGWGLYMLISISERVTFQSRFGTITVDCVNFLNDKEYRENILEHINPQRTYEGFFIHADLKPEVAGRISKDQETLGYFPLNITLNGKSVKKLRAEDKYKHFPIKTEYEGNPVYIDLDGHMYQREDIRRRILAIWYGIPIGGEDWRNYQTIVIDVKQGSPLSPVLPYRRELKKDERYEKFTNFVKEKTVKYCIDYINNLTNTDSRKLILAMDVISAIGTKEDLDMLDRFYVSKSEPYSNTDSFGDDTGEDIIAGKDDRFTSESLSGICTVANNKRTHLKCHHSGLDLLPDDLCLPPGTIAEYSSKENRPSWLSIKEKKVSIEIVLKSPNPFSDNYSWHNVKSIRCGRKKIDVLAINFGNYNGDIYYRKDPALFYDILEIVFSQHLFYEDGDTYDTQKDDFENNVRDDIAQIKKEFDIHDLLKGLSIAGIFARDVISLIVKGKSMAITFRKKGKQITKILKLAA